MSVDPTSADRDRAAKVAGDCDTCGMTSDRRIENVAQALADERERVAEKLDRIEALTRDAERFPPHDPRSRVAASNLRHVLDADA